MSIMPNCTKKSEIDDEEFLQGEDYPALVNVWDNKDDDIFDTLLLCCLD